MMLIMNGVPPDMGIPSMRRLISESCGLEHLLLEESETRSLRGDRTLTIGVASVPEGNIIIDRLNGIKIGHYQLCVQPFGARQQVQPTFQNNPESMYSRRGDRETPRDNYSLLPSDIWGRQEIHPSVAPVRGMNLNEDRYRREDAAVVRDRSPINNRDRNIYSQRGYNNSSADLDTASSRYGELEHRDIGSRGYGSGLGDGVRSQFVPSRDMIKPDGGYNNSSWLQDSGRSPTPASRKIDLSRGLTDNIRSENQYDRSISDLAYRTNNIPSENQYGRPIRDLAYGQSDRFQSQSYSQRPMDDFVRKPADSIRSENLYDRPIGNSAQKNPDTFASENRFDRPMGALPYKSDDYFRSKSSVEIPIVDLTQTPDDHFRSGRQSQRQVDSVSTKFVSPWKRPLGPIIPDKSAQSGPPPAKRPYNEFSRLYEPASRNIPLKQNQKQKPPPVQQKQQTKPPAKKKMVKQKPAPPQSLKTSSNAALVKQKPAPPQSMETSSNAASEKLKKSDLLDEPRNSENIKKMNNTPRSLIYSTLGLVVSKMLGCLALGKKNVKPEYQELIKQLNIIIIDRLYEIIIGRKNIESTSRYTILTDYRKVYPADGDQALIDDLMEKCKVTAPFAAEKLRMEGPYNEFKIMDRPCRLTRNVFLKRKCCIDAAESIVNSALDPKLVVTPEHQYVRDYFKLSVYDRLVEMQNEIESTEDAQSVEKMCIMYNEKCGGKTNRMLVNDGIALYNENNPKTPFQGELPLVDPPAIPTPVLQPKTVETQSENNASGQNGAKVTEKAQQNPKAVQQKSGNVKQKDGKLEQNGVKSGEKVTKIVTGDIKLFKTDSKLDKAMVTQECSEAAEKIVLQMFDLKDMNSLSDEEKKIYKYAHEVVKVRLCTYTHATKTIYTEAFYCKYFCNKYQMEMKKDFLELPVKLYAQSNKTAKNFPYRGKYVKGPVAKSAAALCIALNALKKGTHSFTQLDAEDQKLFAALYGCIEERITTAMTSDVNKNFPVVNLTRRRVIDMYRKMYSHASDAEVLAILVSEYNSKMAEPYTGHNTDALGNVKESNDSKYLREYFCRHLAATAITASVIQNSKTELIPHLGGDMGNVPYNHVHSAVLKRLCDIYIGQSSVKQIIEKYRKCYQQDDDESIVADTVSTLALTIENAKPKDKREKLEIEKENIDQAEKPESGDKKDLNPTSDLNKKADTDNTIELNPTSDLNQNSDSVSEVDSNSLTAGNNSDTINKVESNQKEDSNEISESGENDPLRENGHSEDEKTESLLDPVDIMIDEIIAVIDDLEDY